CFSKERSQHLRNDMLFRDFIKQILPFGIQAIDQINFLLTGPTFDILFPCNCRMNAIAYLLSAR
ncbi:MAG TPA: hypothetical protein VKE92_10360, partial [Anaerolineales bacterium]|nr:hypothetical protein [Anaerolineales bacterium]